MKPRFVIYGPQFLPGKPAQSHMNLKPERARAPVGSVWSSCMVGIAHFRTSTKSGWIVDDKPTLASQGLDKNLAHQARVFGGQIGERLGTSRVCYENLVSQRGKATGQRPPIWPAPMMPIFMLNTLIAIDRLGHAQVERATCLKLPAQATKSDANSLKPRKTAHGIPRGHPPGGAQQHPLLFAETHLLRFDLLSD